MEEQPRRFVYAYALGTTGDLLVDLSCDSLTMADVDDLRSLFAIVEKTLRRVVEQRAIAKHESMASGAIVANDLPPHVA